LTIAFADIKLLELMVTRSGNSAREPLPNGVVLGVREPEHRSEPACEALQAPQDRVETSAADHRMTINNEARVFSPEALAFVVALVREFRPRVRALLEARHARQRQFDAGEQPDFLPETKQIRDGDWTCLPVPSHLADRRVEITGPVDRKIMINALNSGANVFMADFEDSTSPTWDNIVSGHANLIDAVARTLTFSQGDKDYRLNSQPAILFVRPRGLHLPESHVIVDHAPSPAALVDAGLYLFHNAKALISQGVGPYLYLPKLESHLEARLWNDIFVYTENALGVASSSIRATVLIETLPAAFEMNEILFELREHSAGLNCGRWDYIFSFIKKRARDASALLPDRTHVTMDKGFLAAYVRLLIDTCHRRGVHAMGGMAAQIPIKDDPERDAQARQRVRADKLREVTSGHDGTWVAHPGLVNDARSVFDAHMSGPNQLHVRLLDSRESAITRQSLLQVPSGTRTEAGLRHNVRVALIYLESWLRGVGCVPIDNLMEDAATAEISRAQVWQWVHHAAKLDNGSTVTQDRVRDIIDDEFRALCAARSSLSSSQSVSLFPTLHEARKLFETLALAETFEPFLTLPAYEILTRLSGPVDRLA